MSKGVPVGYKIGYGKNKPWYYKGYWHEKKVGRDRKGRGIWRIDYRNTKSRPTQGHGPRPGLKLKWRINAIQYAIKTKSGKRAKYRTRIIGTKRLIRSRGGKMARYRRRRFRRRRRFGRRRYTAHRF